MNGVRIERKHITKSIIKKNYLNTKLRNLYNVVYKYLNILKYFNTKIH